MYSLAPASRHPEKPQFASATQIPYRVSVKDNPVCVASSNSQLAFFSVQVPPEELREVSIEC